MPPKAPKERCTHEKQTRSGSNAVQDRITCQDCKKILYIHWFDEAARPLLRKCMLADAARTEAARPLLSESTESFDTTPPAPRTQEAATETIEESSEEEMEAAPKGRCSQQSRLRALLLPVAVIAVIAVIAAACQGDPASAYY